MKILAFTRVQITIEVETGTYGEDVAFKQVYSQASEEGLAYVRKLVGHNAKIIGEPRVIAVQVEKE